MSFTDRQKPRSCRVLQHQRRAKREAHIIVSPTAKIDPERTLAFAGVPRVKRPCNLVSRAMYTVQMLFRRTCRYTESVCTATRLRTTNTKIGHAGAEAHPSASPRICSQTLPKVTHRPVFDVGGSGKVSPGLHLPRPSRTAIHSGRLEGGLEAWNFPDPASIWRSGSSIARNVATAVLPYELRIQY